jgi:hypothetical protein
VCQPVAIAAKNPIAARFARTFDPRVVIFVRRIAITALYFNKLVQDEFSRSVDDFVFPKHVR